MVVVVVTRVAVVVVRELVVAVVTSVTVVVVRELVVAVVTSVTVVVVIRVGSGGGDKGGNGDV